ncbi:DNA binding protein [Orbilia oligospora]|uniref:DNA binding protein n=2 Tax=Orbilia oligospora TaxID=2813651 RepID=A0A7C8N407_ORBOL|nr:DNA binding protein [Orbilia oligospora]KAF3093150.1 DNA binding protein [Orbilia oligospora]KAF3096865.1 DNA binding protein [Orbilia oligospora]KAF3125502.1 DNA binding protein [Orbilia oligospora]KAF3128642.1 DNA binding protein [Orbilia oligospora]
MPVSQLQKSHLLQPDVRSPLLRKAIGQDGSPISAQAITTKPKPLVDFKQHQAVLPLERQSEKVVQDLINAAIGCITYLRGLIPEKSFCDMSYGGGSNEPQPQTQSGVASQESDKTAKKKETGTRVKHIQRGFSIEADTLLDLIESGIFEALSKGYLKAFQLAVFLDIDHPEVIQEAYTFSINYHRKEFGKSIDIKDITLSTTVQNGAAHDKSAELLDFAQINRSVRALIRRLIVITQNLDLLPENRYLTIRLYHTSDAPEDWAPPMFTQSTGKPLRFDGDISTKLSDEIFGTMGTGLHTVQVRVTSGKRAFSEARADTSDSDEGTAHLPKRRCYGGSVSAHDFIQFAPPRGHLPYIGGKTHLSSQNSFSRKRYGITNGPMLTSSEKDKVIDGSSFETLTVGTAYTGQLNTQALESICPLGKDQSPQKQNTPPILELCRSSSVVPALRLGELKIEELSKTAQESDQSEMYEQQAGNNQIKCECGGKAENMDSIQCDLCDKWQHCECYGFVGDSDSRIGNMHVCYTCLLGKNEPHLLKEMKSFTIARRIVWCLMRSTLGKTFHDIMKTLGIESLEQSVVTGILSVLTEKNYIWVFNPRKIATKRSPNKYRIVESGGALKSMEENLLDPLVNISHHYDLSDTPQKTNLLPESIREKHGSAPLLFRRTADADGIRGEGGGEPVVVETPRSVIKTSDMVNHLKAGNWS